MKTIHLFSILLALTCTSASAQKALNIEVESLDMVDGHTISQPAFWFRTDKTTAAPAVLLLHGCGGPYNRSGTLSSRMRKYAGLLNAEGYHVLITDSLTPRGERELCTQKTGTRKITQLNRRRDALGALQWLARQPEVDANRLAMIGWSNGGSNVLSATNAAHPEVRTALVKPALAVAFYPGCKEEMKRGYQPVAPLLILLGEDDDWTPPGPCQSMAQASTAPTPAVEIYSGSYHGFDSESPVRHRSDVPNGINPGQGVHVGGNENARKRSQERVLDFLQRLHWK